MSSEKKAIELQYQVRKNAREYESTVKDLYTWEKDIKSKEQALKHAPAPTVDSKNAPVRSHVTKANATAKTATTATTATANNKEQQSTRGSPGTPTEKQDLHIDAVAHQHKKANDIKDRGNNYVKQANYERAIEAYNEAIEIYAHDPVYFINRALCYLKQECYERCVEDCEAAIELDKVCVKAYYRRMQANESLGNNMEALKDCTTVLAIDPKNIEAKRSLERINERLRKIASKNGPNFNAARADLIDILPFDKPAYKRSKQALRRVPVVDIVSPRASQDEPKPLRITDEEIDKIFNSNCGQFEEVKKQSVKKVEIKKKLDLKVQETQQPATQSKVDTQSIKPVEKSVETVSSQNIQTKDSTKSTSSLKETIETAPEPTIKLQDSVKTIKVVQKPIETPKSKTISEPPVKQAADGSMEGVPAPPAGTAQFYITWKELLPTQKYHYLKSIQIPNLCKVLGAGFDSDTYADLLRTLHDFYIPNKEPTTAAVLLEISKNDEFNILAMLMSKEEKKMVAYILDAIKEFPKNNAALLDKLGKAYNV